MGLRDRFHSALEDSHSEKPTVPPRGTPGAQTSSFPTNYEQIKGILHKRLIEQIDLARLSIEDTPAIRQQIRRLLEQILQEENPPLNSQERQQLLHDLEDETFGLGPLEPLLRDPTINDILVNRYNEVYIERSGRLERTGITFRDDKHLLRVIERIVSRAGRRIDESLPLVDARLPSGARVNAIIPPLAVDGPTLSIRRTRQSPWTMEDLLRFGTLNPATAELLELAVKAKLNILVSGGTGTGKTTLLNVLVRYIPHSERVISIEDTVEFRLQGLHFVRLETRPPNVEGKGEVTQRDLLKNALRMRPDRILVGEVRGGEALDMLQAMNTGHKGSLTTIHSNSSQDALARLETMILMAGVNLTGEAMRRQIASALDVVVQLERLPDGTRRVVSICEVAGIKEGIIALKEILKFKQRKEGASNGIQGEFVIQGTVPAFIERLQMGGHPVSATLLAGFQKGEA